MIQIDMPMPKSCKGCPFTDWAIYRKALSCTISHRPIAKYERIGNTGREYELVYLYETDEKRRLDCPLGEVEE